MLDQFILAWCADPLMAIYAYIQWPLGFLFLFAGLISRKGPVFVGGMMMFLPGMLPFLLVLAVFFAVGAGLMEWFQIDSGA